MTVLQLVEHWLASSKSPWAVLLRRWSQQLKLPPAYLALAVLMATILALRRAAESVRNVADLIVASAYPVKATLDHLEHVASFERAEKSESEETTQLLSYWIIYAGVRQLDRLRSIVPMYTLAVCFCHHNYDF